jgi:hypothetical protein
MRGPTYIFWADLTPFSLEDCVAVVSLGDEISIPPILSVPGGAAEASVGINPIVTLEKQLLSMIVNLV